MKMQFISHGQVYERFEQVPAWQTAAEMYNSVLDLFEARQMWG